MGNLCQSLTRIKKIRKEYVGMKKEEAVVFLRNHGHQAMIENGVVMIIMAQNRSTVKKIGRFCGKLGIIAAMV